MKICKWQDKTLYFVEEAYVDHFKKQCGTGSVSTRLELI